VLSLTVSSNRGDHLPLIFKNMQLQGFDSHKYLVLFSTVCSGIPISQAFIGVLCYISIVLDLVYIVLFHSSDIWLW